MSDVDIWDLSENPPAWVPPGQSAYDWLASIRESIHDTATASPISQACDPITWDDVAAVDDFAVRYHGGRDARPGQEGTTDDDRGTELNLVAVLRLTSGRWASLSSWNDYTGWGCQDGSTVRIADTREEVVRHGLDKEDRARLGITVNA